MNINRYTNNSHSLNYIYRLMKAYELKSKIRRRRIGYVKIKPEQVGQNILDRDFTASKPNQKWLSDVTEFKVTSGNKVYLCAILDLFDNSIVSYNVSNRNDNQLVFETLNKALTNNPEAKPMFHSDRGYQYTSKMFKRMLDKQGMTQSMSRVGKCIDNGPVENLWGIIKSEMFYLEKFDSTKILKQEIDDYINFYNNVRLQSKLKKQTPIEYRSSFI